MEEFSKRIVLFNKQDLFHRIGETTIIKVVELKYTNKMITNNKIQEVTEHLAINICKHLIHL